MLQNHHLSYGFTRASSPYCLTRDEKVKLNIISKGLQMIFLSFLDNMSQFSGCRKAFLRVAHYSQCHSSIISYCDFPLQIEPLAPSFTQTYLTLLTGLFHPIPIFPSISTPMFGSNRSKLFWYKQSWLNIMLFYLRAHLQTTPQPVLFAIYIYTYYI